MKKILFLAAQQNDALAMLSTIRSYNKQSDCQLVVVAYEYSAQKIFQKYSIPFKTTMSYLGNEELWRVLEDSLDFAKKWCEITEIEKTIRHKGIYLAKFLEQNILHLFQSYLNDIILFQSVINSEKPDRIFLPKRKKREINSFYIEDEEFNDNYIVPLIAQRSAISIEWISAQEGRKRNNIKVNVYLRQIQQNFTKLKQAIKKAIYTNHFIFNRNILLKLKNIFLNDRQVGAYLRNFAAKKKKICFFADLRCAENLIHLLKRDSDIGLICLKLGKGRKFIGSGVLNIGLSEFSNQEIDEVVVNKKKDFLKILDYNNVVTHFEKLFNYQGISFWSIVKKKIEYILGFYLPTMVRVIECSRVVYKRIGIDILILTSDRNAFAKSIIQLLNLNGCPSLVMQHGMECLDEQISKVYGKILVPTFASKKATWGEATKQWQIKYGDRADCLEVTSCPDFDSYLKINQSKDSLRRFLKIRPDKKIILYACTHANRGLRLPFGAETRDEVLQHLKDVVTELACYQQFHLIVRSSPADRHPEEVEEIIRLHAGKNTIVSKLDLIYQLWISDIIITYTSAIGLQGMILGKDVVVYNPTGRPEFITYIKEGAALRVKKKEDLVPTLTNILYNESLRAALADKRKKFVRYCAGEIDGNASKRVADLIYRMLDGAKGPVSTTPSIEKDSNNVYSKVFCT